MYNLGNPSQVLRRTTKRVEKSDARRNNIRAATAVADIVKSSLGPRGMDKMFEDEFGLVTITNDGATIMKNLEVNHPIAKAMVEISKVIDNGVGDGTISAVILAGALLEKAEELLDKKVHPNIIIDGYRKAAEKAKEILKSMAINVNPKGKKKFLTLVAKTSLATKIVPSDANFLAPLIVDGLLSVAEPSEGRLKVNLENVRIEKKAGGSTRNTQLIKGIIFDKQIPHSRMPTHVADAKIALIWDHLEIQKTDLKYSREINISSPDSLRKYREEKEAVMKNLVNTIAKTGANVVFCKKFIDEITQQYFAKAGIMALQDITFDDMFALAKATGGKIVKVLNKLTPNDLGYAKNVEERRIWDGYPKEIFVEGCKNAKTVTLFIRGGTQKLVEGTDRSVHDALCVVKDVMIKPSVIPGAGAPETEIAMKLFDYAKTLHGRKQLAVQKFAEAMEVIPSTLAKNAGIDPMNALIELKARHNKGERTTGVNAFKRKIEDSVKFQVFEPTVVKEGVISVALETVSMILRIDEDIIAHQKPLPRRPPYGRPQQALGHLQRTYDKYWSRFDKAEIPDINTNIA